MGKLAERFGQEVRARRKARGMTQAELAEAAAMSEDWVRRLERGAGAPSFDALEALAEALGVAVADLFAPMSSRDARTMKLDALLGALSETELEWVERLVRVATSRP